MNKRYLKKSNESEYEYGLRLIEIKVEEKPEDLEWSDIVDLLGLNVHKDSLRKAASVTNYSGYAVMKYFKEKATLSSKELDEKLLEIKMETTKLRDERNEFNKMIRERGRSDNMINIFKRIINDPETNLYRFPSISVIEQLKHTDNDVVAVLSDIHYGIVSNNRFNIYNPEIAKERMQEYTTELIQIQRDHSSGDCHLFLGGDLISGIIHSTIRIANAENVISQVKSVSILISNFVYELCKYYNNVHVYSCPGNHSRVFAQKKENQSGEYLDSLIHFYMEASLRDIQNVFVHGNSYNDELCSFEVRGHKFVGVHGHHDAPSSVVTSMTKMLGYIPDVVLMGHRHTNGFSRPDSVSVIASGCLSGMDDYAMENRLVGTPEQMAFLVTDKKPIDRIFNITFDGR